MSALTLLFFCATAYAQCGESLTEMVAAQKMLKDVGWPIGFFMMVYMGIKWIISEGPEERENARRGVIYVVIGVLVLRTGVGLIEYLMC